MATTDTTTLKNQAHAVFVATISAEYWASPTHCHNRAVQAVRHWALGKARAYEWALLDPTLTNKQIEALIKARDECIFLANFYAQMKEHSG